MIIAIFLRKHYPAKRSIDPLDLWPTQIAWSKQRYYISWAGKYLASVGAKTLLLLQLLLYKQAMFLQLALHLELKSQYGTKIFKLRFFLPLHAFPMFIAYCRLLTGINQALFNTDTFFSLFSAITDNIYSVAGRKW